MSRRPLEGRGDSSPSLSLNRTRTLHSLTKSLHLPFEDIRHNRILQRNMLVIIEPTFTETSLLDLTRLCTVQVSLTESYTGTQSSYPPTVCRPLSWTGDGAPSNIRLLVGVTLVSQYSPLQGPRTPLRVPSRVGLLPSRQSFPKDPDRRFDSELQT